jgi:exodeoxyribonuclease V alpha subunit
MDKLFFILEKSELSYLSRALVKFLYEQNNYEHPVVLLAGAFVSHQLNNGEVYLDLNAFFKAKNQFNDVDVRHLKAYFSTDWKTHFSYSKVITDTEGNSPLVWDRTHNRLYLRRYWTYQKTVDDAITQRLTPIRTELPTEITAQLNQLFPLSNITPDWQKIACAVALRSNFCIITGGPGTGKTTTLTKLLVLSISLLRLEKGENFKPDILLAAPTGKAANRVSESINNALNQLGEIIPDDIKTLIPKKAHTLHRLLGSSPDTRLYKQNRHNPLIADIVIIDEASMIDLEMMAALLDALPENAQLILLGDKDQLSSVEAGYVFGNLCFGAEKTAYTKETLVWISTYTNEKIVENSDIISPINQQTVMLKYSHRFHQDSGIGKLANFVNSNENKISDANTLFETYSNDLHKITHFEEFKNTSLKNYSRYKEEIKKQANYSTLDEWAEQVLNVFDTFRILCAIHESDFGTLALNTQVQAWLFPNEKNTWFEGRPVMITKNDYNLGLMNGDIGIALKDENAKLKVAFFSNDETAEKIRWFSTSRISEVQTAFAMTVHKSQGSEFEHTLFVLPSSEVKVLTKELVYTAITRAKKHFTLFFSTVNN